MMMTCLIYQRFYLSGVVFLGITLTACLGQAGHHVVFPAAKTENYADKNLDVGVIHPSQLEIKILGPDQTHTVMDPALERFQSALMKILPDYAEDYPINPDSLDLHKILGIEIHIVSSDTDLYHGVEERYDLKVPITSPSFATIRADTVFGALRALETLSQLFEFGWIDNGEPVFIVNKLPIKIEDHPTYSYRGLMIDTARHYLPMNLIVRNLDVMSMNKLNVLHWHLTDSQSFPWQSKSMPEIAKKGAYHPKRIYTTEDVQKVIHEAYLRGIRVM